MKLALCAVLFSVSAFAQTEAPYTVEGRGEHYAVAIDVHPVTDDQADYDVRVTDLATNRLAWQAHLTGDRSPGEVAKSEGAFKIAIREYSNALGASLTAKDESLEMGWSGPDHQRLINAAGAYRVGGDIKTPALTNHVEPRYPEQARQDRISGIVIMEVIIDKSGAVRDVLMLKELPEGLSEAAMDAVKQWRFAPTMVNGQPVNLVFNLTVNFKLR